MLSFGPPFPSCQVLLSLTLVCFYSLQPGLGNTTFLRTSMDLDARGVCPSLVLLDAGRKARQKFDSPHPDNLLHYLSCCHAIADPSRPQVRAIEIYNVQTKMHLNYSDHDTFL